MRDGRRFRGQKTHTSSILAFPSTPAREVIRIAEDMRWHQSKGAANVDVTRKCAGPKLLFPENIVVQNWFGTPFFLSSKPRIGSKLRNMGFLSLSPSPLAGIHQRDRDLAAGSSAHLTLQGDRQHGFPLEIMPVRCALEPCWLPHRGSHRTQYMPS